MTNRLIALSVGIPLSLGLVFGISACSTPEVTTPTLIQTNGSATAEDQSALKTNASTTVENISKVVDSSEYQSYLQKYENFVGVNEVDDEPSNSLNFKKDTNEIWALLEPYVLFDTNSKSTADYMKLSFNSAPDEESKDVIYKAAMLYDLSILFDNLGGTREFVVNDAVLDEAGNYKLVDGGFIIKNNNGHILRVLNLPFSFEDSASVVNLNGILIDTLADLTPAEVKAYVHNDVIVSMRTVEEDLLALEKVGKDLKDFDLEKTKAKLTPNDAVKIDVKIDSKVGNYTIVGTASNGTPKGSIEFDRKSGKAIDKMDLGKQGTLSKLFAIKGEISAYRLESAKEATASLPELKSLTVNEDLTKATVNEKDNTIDITVDGKDYKFAIGEFEKHLS